MALDISSDGVVFTNVKAGSAAEEVGLQKGDVIASIDGEAVKTSKDVVALQRPRQYYWALVIKRGGQTLTSKVGG